MTILVEVQDEELIAQFTMTSEAPHAETQDLHPQIPRVEPRELADALRNTETKRPLIIDVREAGTGGFIRGAVNVPKPDFDDEEKVEALIAKIKDEQEIVFHCQHSQQRGPTAAYQFLARLEKQLGDGERKPNVKVLRGGFHQFSQEFGQEESLVDQSPLGQ
ncbi:hypothetical protein Poli38472_011159 [Pythium oligandrum]|uniref:Rhodanese domain-containing protein n=1 Tax=Pythium oligandrum TaxID=41045 RepID=A0A8K1CQ32_PYTOL|nr:hypothetical protein Poli38472_011159 [Pythium oligandrum]|eukprot:TMW67539.1 hypothetical protein Poli38472_011159 [Pythium oligandrum]